MNRQYEGFPHSSVGKESNCNAGDPSFDSWVRKILWKRDRLPIPVFLGFSCGSAGKESACNVGDLGSTPGLGRSPGEGKGYPFQYSDLENSMNCIVHGDTKSRTWLSHLHFSLFRQYFRGFSTQTTRKAGDSTEMLWPSLYMKEYQICTLCLTHFDITKHPQYYIALWVGEQLELLHSF